MIIVTGATGFVGRYLVDHLVKQGEDVIACGRTNKYTAFFQDLGVPFIHLDVTDPQGFERLPKEGVHAWVHLAALIPAMVTDMATDSFLRVNTLGTFHALEHCRRNQIKKFLYTTTLFECTEHQTQPITEAMGRSYSLVGDHAAYVISKIAAADYVEHYSQEYGLQGIIFRFTGLLGYGRQEGFFAGGQFHPSAFELFYNRAKAGKPLEVWGRHQARRDSLYVKDAVRAIYLAIKSENARGLYLIGSGQARTIEDDVKNFAAVFSTQDHRVEIVYRPDIEDNTRIYSFDISKARRELSWEPIYNFRDILNDYDAEVRAGRFKS